MMLYDWYLHNKDGQETYDAGQDINVVKPTRTILPPSAFIGFVSDMQLTWGKDPLHREQLANQPL